MKRMENDLTQGSVWKGVVFFSLPYFLSYFLQTLYGMADLFIIGQFDGVASTTAVSIGSQVMHMLTVMLVGLAMGTTVCIGQAVGGKRERESGQAIGNTTILFTGIALVLTVLLFFLVGPIVSIMSTPAEAVAGTRQYLRICFLGIPFITAYNVLSSIFRGKGDSKSPMYFIAIACACNIALDYLFMGAMHMGPAGAALGTTMAQAVSVAAALTVILKRKMLAVRKEDFRPLPAVLHQLLKIGIPVALQDGFIQVSFVLITIFANQRGLTDAAAVGIVEKIMSFVFLIPSSMLSTVSALGAQNIGAGKPERAVSVLRCAIIMAVALSLCFAVSFQLAAENVVGLFTTDTAVQIAGGQYLRSYIWDGVFGGIQFSFSGYFCALGRSELSFLHNLLSILMVRLPGAYFASKVVGTLFPMGFASACGSLLSDFICLIAFFWLKRQGSAGKEKGAA